MKNKTGGIVVWLIMFLFVFFAVFCVAFSVVRVLCDYELIKRELLYWLSIGVSFAFSCGIAAYIFTGVQKEKRSHIRNLLRMELPSIISFCALFIIFMSSIDSKVILSRTEAKSVIDISWTIFSISTTVFLVWNAIIVPYLKKHEPIESKKALLPDEYVYIEKKGSFYVFTKNMYFSIVLLSANLIALAFSTTMLYAYSLEMELISQFVVKATLFLSINSIISLFFNIMVPINEEKKELLMNKRINSTDIKTQNELMRRLDNAKTIFDKLDNDSILDEETKLEIKKTLLKGIIDDDNRHDDSA